MNEDCYTTIVITCTGMLNMRNTCIAGIPMYRENLLITLRTTTMYRDSLSISS